MESFFLSMIPPTVTAQQHKVTVVNGKPKFYDTYEIKQAKTILESMLVHHKPKEPYNRPVKLLVKWCFPKGTHKHGSYKYTRPDTDNLQKMLKDCMTRCGFWIDDSYVCLEIIEKFWSSIPGIYIEVEELEP